MIAFILSLALVVPSDTSCIWNRSSEPGEGVIYLPAARRALSPQDSISFVIKAAGGTLLLLELDYGDTVLDQFSPSGARTASVTFRHAYAAKGVYTVTATVTDVQAGQKKATVDVRVN